MKIDLSEVDIITLQQITKNDVINIQNNKRKPDGKLKDATETQKRIVFPALTCLRRKSDSAMVPIELPSSPMKSSVILLTPPY